MAVTVDQPSTAVDQPDSSPSTPREGLFGHLGIVVVTTGGYFAAVVVSAALSWLLPRQLGYYLDRTGQATGLFAVDGAVVSSAFRLAVGSFPLLFAASVVIIDLLVVRMVTDHARSNWLGLLGWSLLAATLFGLLLSPTMTVFSTYGLVRLLMAPGLGIIIVAVVAVATTAAGIVGLSIPHALFDGASLRSAGRHAIGILVDDPTVVGSPLGVLLSGWVVGIGLILAGMVVIGLAFGIFIIGIVLLPVAFLLWIGAAVGFAGGHVAYRLRTLAVYSDCQQ